MADFETEIGPHISGLPVALEPAGPKPSLLRSQTGAAFASQLLTGRAQLSLQRPGQRPPLEGAIGLYASRARATQRRMPPGYRKSLLA
ncbi:hypothetical protein FF80_02832 [Devosia sp. LC5]|uniref:hypothetical protein n=1 Tax=Devosia sp. LC5 TaxID=1502724 RepID=UPI0004E31C93|nr:hypothetical protein [Devosia sp. LC5]KFC65425.1 hypothetical protein FF80_02832 [Devosia sp. LC5]